jgi:hypothetical protein
MKSNARSRKSLISNAVKLAAYSTALACCLSARPGSAVASVSDDPLSQIGLTTANAQPVSDSQMGAMRGKFVAANGLQILYFGVVVQSNISTANGTKVSSGAAVAINLQTNTPTVVTNSTWSVDTSSGKAGTAAASSSNSAPPAASLSGIKSGVGQIVQLTGIHNTGSNVADIEVTNTNPGSILPAGGIPTGAACTTCEARISSNIVEVSSALPGVGTAAQTVGAQQILQGISLTGLSVSATNTMNMIIQVGHPVSASNLGLATVLQAMPPLPH